jgi:DNA polymerase-4
MNEGAGTETVALCRDCFADDVPARSPACPDCGSRNLLTHPELGELAIAHVDCDAFYATVEKRDNPALKDLPVLVGGSRRGVVLTCCYVARRYGVHSAMPMYRALQLCPEAVVIRPDMAKYRAIGHQVREILLRATPDVEPLSIDEAFLDLTGTARVHHGSPARTLAATAAEVERTVGVTISVGLSYNRSLAKIASGLAKPKGFSVIGRAEAVRFLATQPVEILWGVGKVMQATLAAHGIRRVAQIQALDEGELIRRFGRFGAALHRFSRGIDHRGVHADEGRKSLSSETTFDRDLSDLPALSARLWPLCEEVSGRLKAEEIAARTIVLKLKTAAFRLRTRTVTLSAPTMLAENIYAEGERLLGREADGTRFRLIGIGVKNYAPAADADPADLADPTGGRRKRIELTMDALRTRFGHDAIVKGRSLERPARSKGKPPAPGEPRPRR